MVEEKVEPKKKVRRRFPTIQEISWARQRPYEFHLVPRLAKSRMLRCGRWIRAYDAPDLDVVDLETGELFRATGTHIGERCLMRDFVLSQMRVEVRHFAYFVMQFRNYRRCTSPSLDELVCWYAELHDLRSDNVRRYLQTLKKVGFIESETLLGPLFQLSKQDMLPGAFLGETTAATVRILRMRMDKQRLRDERAVYIGVKEPPRTALGATLACLPAPPQSGGSSVSASGATCVRSLPRVRSHWGASRQVWSSRCVVGRGTAGLRFQPLHMLS